jgi:hypothetical protein
MLSDLSMDDSLRVHLGFEDYILFQPVKLTVAGRPSLIFDNVAVGKIIGGTANVLQVQVFTQMTSEICLQYSLPSVTTAAYPMASLANMIEVVDCQDSYVNVARSAIHDIAHIMALPEVESGLFHMSGCYNCFLIRHSFCGGALVPTLASEYYFLSRPVEPLSMQIFYSLNHLSGMVKKSSYHQGEGATCHRLLCLYFSSEAFCYLFHILSAVSVTASTSQKQAFTCYYDSLTLELKSKCITKTYLRIVTKQGLLKLQKLLGIRVGLGLTKKKPTKRTPLVHCTEGSFLTSLVLPDNVPAELIRKPMLHWTGDSAYLIYTEESRQLTLSIKYSKLLINNYDVVLSRIATAQVHQQVIGGAYISSNFHVNGELLTVLRIENNIALCHYLRNDDDSENSS